MLEKLENMMKKKCFFEKKMFSSFQKLFLQKREGPKYAGGSGPSCSTFRQAREKPSEFFMLYISAMWEFLIFSLFFDGLAIVDSQMLYMHMAVIDSIIPTKFKNFQFWTCANKKNF